MSTKKLLIAAALLTVALSGYRGYRYYYKWAPLVQPGQCLLVESPNGTGPVRMMVLANSSKDNASFVIMQIGPFGVPYVFTYEQLRDLKAKEVSCD
jgi:hypothetical protein